MKPSQKKLLLSATVLAVDIFLSAASVLLFGMIIHALRTNQKLLPIKPVMIFSLVALVCVMFLHSAVVYSRSREVVAKEGKKNSLGFFVPNAISATGALGLFVATVYCLANFNSKVGQMAMPIAIANVALFALILIFPCFVLGYKELSKHKVRQKLNTASTQTKQSVTIEVSSSEEFVKKIFSDHIEDINCVIKENDTDSDGAVPSNCNSLIQSLEGESDCGQRQEILRNAIDQKKHFGDSKNTQLLLTLIELIKPEQAGAMTSEGTQEKDEKKDLCLKYAGFLGYTVKWEEQEVSKVLEDPSVIPAVGNSHEMS